MKDLKDLNKETGKEKVSDAPSINNLKPAETAPKEKKVSKRELSDEQLKRYQEILSDGKAHKIKDLLDEFQLPHTNSGRERLRAANRKINSTGAAFVDGKYIDGEGKHFVMTMNGKG